MTDNERVQILQTEVVDAVNRSRLPLAVKALALENIMLRVKLAELTASQNSQPKEDGDADA